MSAVTLVVVVVMAIAAAQQVAKSDVAPVRPFTEEQLPSERVQRPGTQVNEPGLGHVALLDAPYHAKLSTEMSTMFDIYTSQGKSELDIEFRGRSPALDQDWSKLDVHTSYQYDLATLAESGFNPSQQTVILIPGYNSPDESDWQKEARELLLEIHRGRQLGVNVIEVGWSDSNKGLYGRATANTPLVARQVVVFLHYLAQVSGTNLRDQAFLDQIHLVGHSLGAHIAGFVGQDLGGRAGRITGLDPAGPLFLTVPAGQRLDRTNAQLVEVLHTNAGHLDIKNTITSFFTKTLASVMAHKPARVDIWFGHPDRLGHIDYFANDGSIQTGCGSNLLKSCDHSRAHDIYLAMLRNELFWRAHGSSSVPSVGRLWASRADSYESFQSGSQLGEFCPQQSAPTETINRCVAPLLDFWTPLSEYISELRNKFGINCDREIAQSGEDGPRFYFKSQAPYFVGDTHLLKVHLDPKVTLWDAQTCSLTANLKMEGGGELAVVMRAPIEAGQSVLALPFTHPGGPEGRANLRVLLGMLNEDETERDAESIKTHFRSAFPASISMQFTNKQISVCKSKCSKLKAKFESACKFSIKAIEVHPVSGYTGRNVGALYGMAQELPESELKFADSGERARRLSSYLGELTPTAEFAVKLESAFVDRQLV